MNTLLLLVVFSLVAIGAIAVLLHLLGYSRGAVFIDGETAREAFLAEYPDLVVEDVTLGDGGSAAILTLAHEQKLGLIRAIGKFTLARVVAPADVSKARVKERTLILHFHDFADPAFRITFTSKEDASRWARMFEWPEGTTEHA